MKSLTKFALIGVILAATVGAMYAKEDEKTSDQVKRIDAAATVLDEIMAAPDKGIPQDILSSAKCVAVIPSMIKGGFIVGGRYGKGVATCRTASGWSAPLPSRSPVAAGACRSAAQLWMSSCWS